MEWEKLLPVIVTSVAALLSGVVGFLLKHFLDKKAQFSSKNAEIKRQMYQEFTDMIISFFEDAKKDETPNRTAEIYSFYKKSILYGSPRVINSFNDFMHYVYANEGKQSNLRDWTTHITSVFGEMRRDIGLSNKGLGDKNSHLMKGMQKDFDLIMSGAVQTPKAQDISQEVLPQQNRQQRRKAK